MIDDCVIVIFNQRELVKSLLHTAFNVVRGICSPADKTAPQGFVIRREYEHRNAVGIQALDIHRALDLYLKNEILSLVQLFKLAFQSPVIIAAVLRVFNDISLGDRALELFFCDEVIFSAVDLAGAWGSCGCRDGEAVSRMILHQACVDGSLSGSRSTRYDKQYSFIAAERCCGLVFNVIFHMRQSSSSASAASAPSPLRRFEIVSA